MSPTLCREVLPEVLSDLHLLPFTARKTATFLRAPSSLSFSTSTPHLELASDVGAEARAGTCSRGPPLMSSSSSESPSLGDGDREEGYVVGVQVRVLKLGQLPLGDDDCGSIASLCELIGQVKEGCEVAHCQPGVHGYMNLRGSH